MNIFSIKKNGDFHELSREKYIEITSKKYPFYTDKGYYAICPSCGNPIQIINLFGDEYREENTGKKKMHGRHIRKDIIGVASYNQEEYDNCKLSNPIAFGLERIREDDRENEELKKLIEKNKEKLSEILEK